MDKFRTHYDNLNVTQNAQSDVIKAAYKSLCQSYHPDKYIGSDEQANRIMKFINKAYSVLSDPLKRSEYDKSIANNEYKFSSHNIIYTAIKRTSKKNIKENYSEHLTCSNNAMHTENASRLYLSPSQLENEHHLWVA